MSAASDERSVSPIEIPTAGWRMGRYTWVRTHRYEDTVFSIYRFGGPNLKNAE